MKNKKLKSLIKKPEYRSALSLEYIKKISRFPVAFNKITLIYIYNFFRAKSIFFWQLARLHKLFGELIYFLPGY